MNAYIYSVDSMEVVAIIAGDTNKECEAKAEELNYMGVDEYGLAYSNNGLTTTDDTEEHDTKVERMT